MKLSPETIAILSNFSNINQSIVIRPGSRLTTKIANGDSIVAAADVVEEFPKEFGIFDLKEFLSIAGMLEDASIDFTSGYNAVITSGRTRINYAFTNPALLVPGPANGVKAMDVVASFEMTSATYKELMTAAKAMKLPNITIKANGTSLYLTAANRELNNSNVYSTEVGETDAMFNAIIDTESLALIPVDNRSLGGDYNVSVSQRMIKFSSTKRSLTYWIALSKNSNF